VLKLTAEEIQTAVTYALTEDIGSGDVTTLACIPPDSRSRARLNAREPLVVAGLAFAETAFRLRDPNVRLSTSLRDGDHATAGTCLLEVEGSTRALLTAERVALNYLQRLSGIASLAARHVEAIRGTSTQILDTRKTTPGWRRFEKYAVACGGATNHRTGLYDLVLIKDNHLAALQNEAPNPIAAAIHRARAAFPLLRVEVEADTLAQALQAAAAGADIILLDNMPPAQLREAVLQIAGRSKTEASGGIRLESIRAVAETGVDFISVGALTHSARSMDIGMDFDPASP
jgi:nicotinate-nucleotide pyrophosphorylase (carboxylating)